ARSAPRPARGEASGPCCRAPQLSQLANAKNSVEPRSKLLLSRSTVPGACCTSTPTMNTRITPPRGGRTTRPASAARATPEHQPREPRDRDLLRVQALARGVRERQAQDAELKRVHRDERLD